MTAIPKAFSLTLPRTLLCLVLTCLTLHSTSTRALSADEFGDSVVKIFVTSNRMDYFRPWQSIGNQAGTGSGCIIDGGRILTNAHVIDSAAFIQVRKESDPRKYTAKVEAVAYDADLALLSVNDPEFFEGTTAVSFGPLPFLQDSVVVVGFPEGGDKISITGGVVSRIEIIPYSKSGRKLLGVQIDAAINPGNSGGPVYRAGQVVGIAMQVMSKSQNIGYLIPTPIIEHFLKDIADGHYDGFPTLGIDTIKTENKAMRQYYHLGVAKGGVLVNRVLKYSPAESFLKPGDTLIEIDGIELAVDGTYPFRGNERLEYAHVINSKYLGDALDVKVIRDGQTFAGKIKLTPYENLIPPPGYFEKPPYYIYGGLVFSVLSADLLKSWGSSWWEKAPVPFLNYLVGSGVLNEEAKQEVVVLLSVLPDDLTAGYLDYNHEVISKVNGQKFRSFQEFVKLVELNKDPFCIIETDQTNPIILKTHNIQAITKEILDRNNIPAQYSTDVKDWISSF